VKQLVVAGNGMAGVACVEHILQYSNDFEITIFGEGTHVHYDRTRLPSVLAREKTVEDIVLDDFAWYQTHGIRARLGVRLVRIDVDRKVVIDEDRGETEFDTLILATGSIPLVPRLPGLELENVHLFHTLEDLRALEGKASPGVKAVVMGAGSMAVDVAQGLKAHGCAVTLVSTAVESLTGSGKVTGVRLPDGKEIAADLVVLALGVKPNVALARGAGLAVGRGIVVNDAMQTSHPDIYAVGACTEHRGQTIDSPEPVLRQSKILAAALTGQPALS
jgi:nitrite reductase [NAD(P)H] large subunit